MAALVPMVVGAIWYNEKVFGRAWMNASGVTDDMINSGNMAKIMGFSLLFALMLSFFMPSLVTHQMGLFGLMGAEPDFMVPGSAATTEFEALMAKYGDRHRTFGHGAMHGAMAGVFMALPIIGIISLFERRGWRYRLIQGGYWTVTLAIMGAIICGWK
ncbi:MAG: DUF1761 domain-containing protein [Bacteroidota bacterium]